MTSKFWWQPAAGQTYEEIDFGETLSDMQFNPLPSQSVSEGLTGGLVTTRYNSRAMVRLVHERFPTASLARDLYALEDHLKAGGLVASAVNGSAAYAGYLVTLPARGATSLTLVGKPFQPTETPPTIPDGDEIEIIGSGPRAKREFVTVDGDTTGNSITLTEALRYDYTDCRWVFVRHRGYWPLLRLPKDRRADALMTHDHRISYTFDAQLEEAIDLLDLYASIPESRSTSTTVTGPRSSPEEVNVATGEDPNTGPTGGQVGGGGDPPPGGLPGLGDLLGGGIGVG